MNEEAKVFDLSKKYKYRCGAKPDAVFRDDFGDLRSVDGIHAFSHRDDGSLMHLSTEDGTASERDLIEISPYDDWEMDAPILVWNKNKDDAKRRYFSGVSSKGLPTAHELGTTSYSNMTGNVVEWQHAELWEGDDD